MSYITDQFNEMLTTSMGVASWAQAYSLACESQMGSTFGSKLILLNDGVIGSELILDFKGKQNKRYLLNISEQLVDIAKEPGNLNTQISSQPQVLGRPFKLSELYMVNSMYANQVIGGSKLDAFNRLHSMLSAYVVNGRFLDDLCVVLSKHKSETIKSEILKKCSELGISPIHYKMNSIKNTVEVTTCDYILALYFQKEFISICNTFGIDVNQEELVQFLEYRNTSNLDTLSCYYIKYLGKLKGKYSKLQMFKDSLSEIVPIAVKFGEESNWLWEALTHPETTQMLKNSWVTDDDFREFQESLMEFKAPTVKFSHNPVENSILYSSKGAIFKLLKINFNMYNITLFNKAIRHLILKQYGDQVQFGSTQWEYEFKQLCEIVFNTNGEYVTSI